MKRNKRLIKIVSIVLFTFVLIVLFVNYKVVKNTENQVFTDAHAIPFNKCGLLLGTSKLLKSGKPNAYFFNRIHATVLLFREKKIQHVVISGDNSSEAYNEPQDMKEELMKRGIPEDKITLDYAGFRTFDSVFRMKEIFGQTQFTIISQEFHNQRAIYIANKLELKAIGYNAKDVNAYYGFKTKVREKLARLKMMIDLLIDRKPKFLGDKISID